jgi:LruC domain-containing protein
MLKIILKIKYINLKMQYKIQKTTVIKTIVMAIILFYGTINQSVYGQCCNGYTVWTPGMWIGPAGYNCAGTGVQYYQTVSYNGRLYTHKGYCSNAGPGHWDFKDIGACTPSSGSINAGTIGSNQTICSGNTPSALTNVTSPSGGSGYSYQWQSSSNNSTWNNIGGASSITYSPGTLTSSTYIRRVVSSSCNTPVNTAPILITVNPANTAGTASSNPTLCINTALTNITIATTGATGIGTATGLPAGVTAAWASNTITISGTPTASGTFNYTIPLTGGCGSVNATGTITVTPARTAGSPSSTPTLSINNPLTNITHTTTGATGIANAGTTGANGLPAGVAASWNNNTITIYGTPSAVGTYNYSIPLSGGCGSVNATGTITVNSATPATPGTISGTATQCAGLTSQTYSIAAVTNATSYTWTVPTGWSITGGTGTNSITVTVGASGQNGNVTVTATNSGGTSAAQTLAATVSSNNTIGTASSTPTVCINTALTNITHTTTGATGIANAGTIGANGLPAGVAASWNGNLITIFGTPSAAGIYNYSIPLLGGCGSVNATGTITVTPARTAGSPSSTPTLCINTALTNIAIATTGATGIGTATGLPAGVTAAWASNTITITGTPTDSGTFSYTIPLTGGCGSVNAIGTITVKAAITAGSPSSTPTLFNNTALTNITIATTGATGIGTATGLPAGVTAAWASNTITISGTPTASGTFGYSIPLTGGCGSINATGTITITPNIAASNASFTAVTSNTLTLNWTKGSGTHRIVIAKKSSAPSSDPSNGQSYTANGATGSGSALGGGFVVYNGDGNTVNITNLEAGTEYYFSIIEYYLGTGTINYANNLKLVTNWSTSASDIDNDGVADADDDYPNDVNKSFNNLYPAASHGTLMFEDLWPGKGDYDFNDLIVNYQYNTVTNAANQVVEVRYSFVTRAVGGSLHNGFAFQLDGINPNRITSVTGSKAVGASWLQLNNNGTEAGQGDNANIVVFDDAYKLLPTQGGYSFINTYQGSPDSGKDTTTIVVKFIDNGVVPTGGAVNYSSFETNVFNPYIILNQVRGKEVHLVDRLPSSKVDASFFGTGQDKSNPGTGSYYKTANNLPWAINVTSSIPYPQERTDISEAFLKFIPWASSNGTTNQTWYLNTEGNREATKLIIR